MARALRAVVTLLARWSLATLERDGQVDAHTKAHWSRISLAEVILTINASCLIGNMAMKKS